MRKWKDDDRQWIRAVHMQRGGQRELVSASRNGVVRLWDIRMDQPLKKLLDDAGHLAHPPARTSTCPCLQCQCPCYLLLSFGLSFPVLLLGWTANVNSLVARPVTRSKVFSFEASGSRVEPYHSFLNQTKGNARHEHGVPPAPHDARLRGQGRLPSTSSTAATSRSKGRRHALVWAMARRFPCFWRSWLVPPHFRGHRRGFRGRCAMCTWSFGLDRGRWGGLLPLSSAPAFSIWLWEEDGPRCRSRAGRIFTASTRRRLCVLQSGSTPPPLRAPVIMMVSNGDDRQIHGFV